MNKTNAQTAYVSGKITGLLDLNIPKFKAAENLLRHLGYTIILNPHVLCSSLGAYREWHIYMRKCLGALPDADVLYLLDDWYDSRGAIIEVIMANFLRIPVMSIETMQLVPKKGLFQLIVKYYIKTLSS